MRARWRLERTEEDAAIDMTPMLDVVFIMLIFFIVSTTFIRDEGVQINRPSAAATAQVQKSQGIVVSIDPQGKIWLDQEALPFAQLAAKLRLALAKKAQASVLIKADQDAATGDLIKVLDLIKSLGVEQVAVATEHKAG